MSYNSSNPGRNSMHCATLSIFALSAVCVCAQSPAPVTPSTSAPLAVTRNLGAKIDLNVLLLNPKNPAEPLPDLSKFSVLEDGVPQSVTAVSDSNSPISLSFVIDDSGSTADSSKSITQSVEAIAQSLPAGSEISLVRFANQSFLDLPFTPIEGLDPKVFSLSHNSGGTAFYDTLVATSDYLVKNAHYRRRALVLVTDGEDNASTLNLSQTIKRLNRPSAPVLYALFLREDKMPGRELRHGQRVLELLTNQCGGLIFRPVKQKGVAPPDAALAAANNLANAVRGQIVLTYTPNSSSDGKQHKVDVTLPQGGFEMQFERTYSSPSK